MHQQEQRVLGTVSIPERENCVVVPAVSVMYRTVQATVGPVHVVVERGIYHGMVEGCVQHAHFVRSAGSLQFAKLRVPPFSGFRLDAPEGFVPALRIKVLDRTFDGSGAKCHAYNKFLGRVAAIPVKVEPACHSAACHFREVADILEFAPEALVLGGHCFLETVILDRAGEADREVGIMLARPALGDTVSGKQGVADHAGTCPESLAFVIVDAVREIKDKMALRISRVRVSVYCRAFGSREFSPDAVIVERDCIVAGIRRLRLVAESAPVALSRLSCRAGVQMQGTRYRHEQDVAQVRMPRAA